jgi:hypothetical protein
MPDIAHYFGGDLIASDTGGLLVVDGLTEGIQRVLRRLLTNPGDYLWEPTYGAGLGRYIGRPAAQALIQARIRRQMMLEPIVAKTPPPTVVVAVATSGVVTASITFANTLDGATVPLTFQVGVP